MSVWVVCQEDWPFIFFYMKLLCRLWRAAYKKIRHNNFCVGQTVGVLLFLKLLAYLKKKALCSDHEKNHHECVCGDYYIK